MKGFQNGKNYGKEQSYDQELDKKQDWSCMKLIRIDGNRLGWTSNDLFQTISSPSYYSDRVVNGRAVHSISFNKLLMFPRLRAIYDKSQNICSINPMFLKRTKGVRRHFHNGCSFSYSVFLTWIHCYFFWAFYDFASLDVCLWSIWVW